MSADWFAQLMDRYYNKDFGWVDGTTEFHELIRSCASPDPRILEVGAGPSNATSRFLSTLGEVTGLDVDPEVYGNDALTASSVFDGKNFPYEDSRFDICVSNFVLEHLAVPSRHLEEVHRILKDGGVYVTRTPNSWHYVSLVARATPHWFHSLVANRLRGLPTEGHEPYPTYHRLNSRKVLSEAALTAGFHVNEIRLVEKEPSYGRLSPLLFLPMVFYERTVNRFTFLQNLRVNIFAVLRKPLRPNERMN